MNNSLIDGRSGAMHGAGRGRGGAMHGAGRIRGLSGYRQGMGEPVRHDDEPPGPVLPAGAGEATLPGDQPNRPIDERPPRPGQTRAQMRAPSPGGEPEETQPWETES